MSIDRLSDLPDPVAHHILSFPAITIYSCSGFNMGYWKLHNLPVNQLKEVTIELSSGSNGIEFASYILEYAQNMKKLVILHSPQQSNSLRKLNKSKRTSNATIVFQEDQQRGRRVVR